MDRNDTANVLVAFLLGAVTGGVAALLLAPSSGEETRKKLAEGLGKAKDSAGKGLGKAKEFAGSQKDALKEAYEEGKKAYRKNTKKKDE